MLLQCFLQYRPVNMQQIVSHSISRSCDSPGFGTGISVTSGPHVLYSGILYYPQSNASFPERTPFVFNKKTVPQFSTKTIQNSALLVPFLLEKTWIYSATRRRWLLQVGLAYGTVRDWE